MKVKTIAVVAVTAAALLLALAFFHTWDMLSEQQEQISALFTVQNSTKGTDDLNAILEASRADVQNAQDETRLVRSEADELARKLETAELLAGMTGVRGPGVTVTLSDSNDSGVVHDSDLLMIINELRDAGAEALCVNGERLLATSEIRCAGAIVSINNRRYSSPFVVSAVGDAETMYNALYIKGGVLDILKQWKLGAIVEKCDVLEIDAYDGTSVFTFAEMIEE